MKLLLIMLLFIISCTETNQKFSSNNKIELFNTSSEITIKDFKNHIGFLASDDLKGRASCLLYTSPSPRDKRQSRMPSSA